MCFVVATLDKHFYPETSAIKYKWQVLLFLDLNEDECVTKEHVKIGRVRLTRCLGFTSTNTLSSQRGIAFDQFYQHSFPSNETRELCI